MNRSAWLLGLVNFSSALLGGCTSDPEGSPLGGSAGTIATAPATGAGSGGTGGGAATTPGVGGLMIEVPPQGSASTAGNAPIMLSGVR